MGMRQSWGGYLTNFGGRCTYLSPCEWLSLELGRKQSMRVCTAALELLRAQLIEVCTAANLTRCLFFFSFPVNQSPSLPTYPPC